MWRSALFGAALASGMATIDNSNAQEVPADSDGGTVTLPAVTVEDATVNAGETATSPVKGYVASRSAGATKSDTALIETPQSVSVITSDQMKSQDVQNLNDALRYTAGVTPETRGAIGSRYDLFKVRGFDADTYWNGLKLIGNGNFAIPQLDTSFMGRIDVVKGASSVLYGQAHAGGVVDEISKQPASEPYHEIGIEAGTFGHWLGTMDISGPVAPDGGLLYRFVGVGLDEDGQIDHTKSQRIGVMPSLTFRGGDDSRLNLYALYQYDPAAGAYGLVPAKGSALPAKGGSIDTSFFDGDPDYDRFERTQGALGYRFETALAPPITLRMNGRWFHISQAYRSIYGTGDVSDDGTLLRNIYKSNDESDTFAFDNQIEGKLLTGPVRHTLLGGIDYQRLRTSYWAGGIYDTSVVPSINVYSPQYGLANLPEPNLTKTSMTSDQVGTYIQDQIALGGFVLTASGREDWASSKTLTSGQKQFDRATTGRVGLTYVFDNGIAPYVSWSQSFVPQAGTDALTGKMLSPEHGRQYEAGVKFQPNGINALFTGAVFDLDRSNLATYTSGLGYVQNGEARSRGFELEGRGEVLPNLGIVASYTYLDTRYVHDDSGLQGKRLAGIPHNSLSLWGDYKLTRGPLTGLDAGLGVRWFDSSPNTSNTFSVDGATLVDATLRYDLEQLSTKLAGADIFVNGKNIFDEKYVASCYYGDASGATNWCGYGDQRTITGGFHYRW
ncbi:MAG: TonB-dependent siderophore receptor [Azospirillaceae bacterium]|nr:TonB-dependent siderophore receptor [Azospirillaceae bacterium]